MDIDLCNAANIEIIKNGDFTSVFRVELKNNSEKIGGNNRAIIKICRFPLDTELEIYRFVQNHSLNILPRIFWERKKNNYCTFLIEDLGRDILRDRNIEKELLINVLSTVIEVHNYCANCIGLSLPSSIPVRQASSFVEYFVSILSKVNAILKIEKIRYEFLLRKIENLQQLLLTCRLTLVHGDLYADNIISRESRYFLIDWGFAHFGVEYADIASILETNSRKNGNINFTFDQKVDIYRNAYRIVNKRQLDINKAKLNLFLGSLMTKVYFIDWIIFRINNNYWKDTDPRQKLSELLNDLLVDFCSIEELL